MDRRLATATALIAALGTAACDDKKDVRYSMEDNAVSIAAPRLAARERCYGIALAQANDCAGEGTQGPHTAQRDYQGNAWTYVKTGDCALYGGTGPDAIVLPGGRKGSLRPLRRDLPPNE